MDYAVEIKTGSQDDSETEANIQYTLSGTLGSTAVQVASGYFKENT